MHSNCGSGNIHKDNNNKDIRGGAVNQKVGGDNKPHKKANKKTSEKSGQAPAPHYHIQWKNVNRRHP